MRHARRNAYLWLAGLALLTGCGALDSTCEDAGRTFEEGDQWTCSDGCNSCSCQGDGKIATTAAGCPSPPGPAAGKLECWDGDSWHRHGDSWTADGGCALSCNDGDPIGDCS